MQRRMHLQQYARLRAGSLACAEDGEDRAMRVASPPIDGFGALLGAGRNARRDRLVAHLRELSVAFDGFENLISQFIGGERLTDSDDPSADAECLLDWVERTQPLTDVQRDHVAFQRARLAVLRLARGNEDQHALFQARLRSNQKRPALSAADADARVCINPIRVWTRLTAATLSQVVPGLQQNEGAPPLSVVVFAVQEGIAVVALDLQQQAVLNELADYQPCTIRQWAAVSRAADGQQLIARCNRLIETGLAAVC